MFTGDSPLTLPVKQNFPTDISFTLQKQPSRDIILGKKSKAIRLKAKTEVPRDVRNSKVQNLDKFRRYWSQH